MHVQVNGRACKEYTHKGMSFIEARHGTNYTVKIKNDNPYRVMAVLSVDGLDVVTGKPAEETNTGYIIDAYSSLDVKGYRISDDNSASFIFTSKGKSYVQQAKSNATNAGVIGLRTFKEKLPYYYSAGWTTTPGSNIWTTGGTYTTLGSNTVSSIPCTYTVGSTTANVTGTTTAANNCSNYFSSTSVSNTNLNASSGILRSMNVSSDTSIPLSHKQFDTGTGWGSKLEDKVTRVSFEKGDMLVEMSVYYASKEALVEMGVDLQNTPKIAKEPVMPKAFGNYCTPPKGWNG
jgi:hypothetical protein